MRSIRRAVLTLVGVAFIALAGASTTVATQPHPEHKVGICHRTASDTNPYVYIEVDEAAVDTHLHNGQGHPPKTNEDGSPRNDYLASSSEDCTSSAPSSTPTPSSSSTPSDEPSLSPSPSPSQTSSPEPSGEPSATPTTTPTSEPSSSPSASPSDEPSESPQPSSSPTPTPSSSNSPSPSASNSPVPSDGPSLTAPPTDTEPVAPASTTGTDLGGLFAVIGFVCVAYAIAETLNRRENHTPRGGR